MAAAQPEAELTDKQAEVLAHLRAQRSVKEIAELMGVSTNSVYNHQRKIREAGIEVPTREGSIPLPPLPESDAEGGAFSTPSLERDWLVGGLRGEIKRLRAERADTIERLDRQITAYNRALTEVQSAHSEEPSTAITS